MESQSGHHPGHHGHSAPHSSTLPHHVHVGHGSSQHHQINLDEKHHHQHQHSSHHTSHSKQKHTTENTQKNHSSHHTTHHHHHHHVSRKLRRQRDFPLVKFDASRTRAKRERGKLQKKAFRVCDCARVARANESIGRAICAAILLSDLWMKIRFHDPIEHKRRRISMSLVRHDWGMRMIRCLMRLDHPIISMILASERKLNNFDSVLPQHFPSSSSSAQSSPSKSCASSSATLLSRTDQSAQNPLQSFGSLQTGDLITYSRSRKRFIVEP